MIEVTGPAAVLMTISETTLSETILLNRPEQAITNARAHDIVGLVQAAFCSLFPAAHRGAGQKAAWRESCRDYSAFRKRNDSI